MSDQTAKTLAIVAVAVAGLAFMQSAGMCTLFGGTKTTTDTGLGH